MPEIFEFLQKVAIYALPILLAITVHEAAHGWMANKLGDDTATRLDRVTLNPFKHIDPVGTIFVPLMLMLTSSFLFGWAKPVPVRFDRLNQPKRDMALVAIAGPAANLLMALLWGMGLKIGLILSNTVPWAGVPFVLMAQVGISINLLLMMLNLLPLLPLDGGRVLAGLLPNNLSRSYSKTEPFGMFILLALVAIEVITQRQGPLTAILEPALATIGGILELILGL